MSSEQEKRAMAEAAVVTPYAQVLGIEFPERNLKKARAWAHKETVAEFWEQGSAQCDLPPLAASVSH